jgi:hypothetical protein
MMMMMLLSSLEPWVAHQLYAKQSPRRTVIGTPRLRGKLILLAKHAEYVTYRNLKTLVRITQVRI